MQINDNINTKVFIKRQNIADIETNLYKELLLFLDFSDIDFDELV